MKANSKGQDLVEHLKAVSNIAVGMGKKLGISEKKDYKEFCLSEQILLAGLLHDIGKAIASTQAFYSSDLENFSDEDETIGEGNQYRDKDFPLHHEISWAYLINKLGESDNTDLFLSAIYWHHAQPINDKYKELSESEEILEFLSDKDKESLDDLYNSLKIQLKPTQYSRSKTVPSLFVRDVTSRSSLNAQALVVRSCLISADRYVSALSPSEVNRIVNASEEQIRKIIDENF